MRREEIFSTFFEKLGLKTTLYGYYRCSATEQHEERQIHALKDASWKVISGDKVTGTSDFSSSPDLTALLNEMEYGTNSLAIQNSSLNSYKRFVIVDYLFNKGGTAKCLCNFTKIQ